jgi:hypothetical protein
VAGEANPNALKAPLVIGLTYDDYSDKTLVRHRYLKGDDK